MQANRTIAFSALLMALSGGAFAAADQTQPGASHGPSSAQNAQDAAGITPNSSKSIGPSTGPSGVGGSTNGMSGAGAGTRQGSGGMQPRLNGNGGTNGGTSPSTTNGGAQGL
ncbi:hypothetical protein AWB77_01848 [Caballeronia fortuita]|uniref:Lipoprotein n=1 Tax=Caballeronia fortuita TaxID=1777138 RepID=A0A158AKJ8_9BURK|nr:hypothetical protein [Caballeronia fortuita]SAK58199.1 hypothetical protein AWB77_01848 [Caballeronia fortuita]